MSGCGDAYAAGIGVSIANLTSAGGLADVMTAAFSGALSVSQTVNDAAAVAQGVAIAFASELGCEQLLFTHADAGHAVPQPNLCDSTY